MFDFELSYFLESRLDVPFMLYSLLLGFLIILVRLFIEHSTNPHEQSNQPKFCFLCDLLIVPKAIIVVVDQSLFMAAVLVHHLHRQV